MSTLETLIAARALIAKPGDLLRDRLAVRRCVDGGLISTSFDDPGAVAFCTNGAVLRAADFNHGGQERWKNALLALVAALPSDAWRPLDPDDYPDTLANFNDNCSDADVIALFDRAIEAQRKTGTDISVFEKLLDCPREREAVE